MVKKGLPFQGFPGSRNADVWKCRGFFPSEGNSNPSAAHGNTGMFSAFNCTRIESSSAYCFKASWSRTA
eukprot:1151188-Amphidinium_carterae.1